MCYIFMRSQFPFAKIDGGSLADYCPRKNGKKIFFSFFLKIKISKFWRQTTFVCIFFILSILKLKLLNGATHIRHLCLKFILFELS